MNSNKNSSVPTADETGVLTYTPERKTNGVLTSRNDRIKFLHDFEKKRSCIFNATGSQSHPRVKGSKYDLAELFFTKDGKLLNMATEDDYEIRYFDEVKFPFLGDLFRFLFDFSHEIAKIYPGFEICFVSINGEKSFRWVDTYAHWCYAEGKITEDVLIDWMMNGVSYKMEVMS